MNLCTAPQKGHLPGSQEERDCPLHGVAARPSVSPAAQAHARPTSTARVVLQGEDAVREMIRTKLLERLDPGEDMSERNVTQATDCIVAARVLVREGLFEQALDQAYTSARKSATALMERQGFRSRAANSHRNTQEVLRHQLGKRVAAQFNAARRSRHETDYTTKGSPEISKADAESVISFAEGLLAQIRTLLPKVSRFPD